MLRRIQKRKSAEKAKSIMGALDLAESSDEEIMPTSKRRKSGGAATTDTTTQEKQETSRKVNSLVNMIISIL